MTAQRKTAKPGERSEAVSQNTRLHLDATASKVVSTTKRIKYTTKTQMRCKVRQKPCKNSAIGSLNFKKDQINVLRLALLIFKSGLNRILLTELRSGAATPKKMFLMLARLSEIIKPMNGQGQQQLLIDNYI